jgi:hypothetical protein
MRLKRSETTVQIPGHPRPPTPAKQPVAEWVCPDCDYFEEADEEKA